MRQPQTIFKLKEFAVQVGVPYGTVKRWVHEGMPTRRQGRGVTVHIGDARAWLDEHKPDSCSFDRSNVVYFAQPEGEQRVKIGWTNDVPRRLRELRKVTRKPMHLLATVQADHKTEIAIHDMLAELSLGAEWFTYAPAIGKMIDALQALPIAKARTDAERSAEGKDRQSAA